MKILFFGTDYYATIAFKRLLEISGFDICGVITTSKKPSMPFTYKSVVEMCSANNLNVFDLTASHHLADISLKLADLKSDIGLVYSFGHLIPPTIIDIPKYGLINLHPSFLPQYQGPTPVPQAILDGCPETGVTLISINEYFDKGDILAQKTAAIDPNDNTLTLTKRLVNQGMVLFNDLIKKYPHGNFPRRKQNSALATATKIIKQDDAQIDFSANPEIIDRKIRAFYPKPMAWSYLSDLVHHYSDKQDFPDKWHQQRVKIHHHQFINNAVSIKIVQLEGKTPITWDQFRHGYLR